MDTNQHINESANQLHSNRWLTTILTQSFEQREAIRLALEKENIESRPLWKPMHLQPVFKDAQYYGGSVSQDLFNRGLCLPSGTAITKEDLERVVDVIKKTHPALPAGAKGAKDKKEKLGDLCVFLAPLRLNSSSKK